MASINVQVGFIHPDVIAERWRIATERPRQLTLAREPVAPVRQLIASCAFASSSPEQQHVVELAFNCAIRKMGLVDRDDPICALMAKKMVELYSHGITNALALSEITVRELTPPEV